MCIPEVLVPDEGGAWWSPCYLQKDNKSYKKCRVFELFGPFSRSLSQLYVVATLIFSLYKFLPSELLELALQLW